MTERGFVLIPFRDSGGGIIRNGKTVPMAEKPWRSWLTRTHLGTEEVRENRHSQGGLVSHGASLDRQNFVADM